MDERECEVCAKLVKEKYRHYKAWKPVAIIFICLTVLFAILYFASGDLFKTTVVEYDNSVEIENKGGNNTNSGNGNITVETQNDNTGGVIVLCVIILSGGIICGCYIISQASRKNKE